MPGLPPAPAASPSIWSRISAATPAVHQARADLRTPRPGGSRDHAPAGRRRCSTTQRRRDRVAQPDDRVAPGPAAAGGAEAHAVRPVELAGPQPRRERLDLGLDGADLVVVDLGADRRVHQLAHGLGERPVERRWRSSSSGSCRPSRSRPRADSRTRSSFGRRKSGAEVRPVLVKCPVTALSRPDLRCTLLGGGRGRVPRSARSTCTARACGTSTHVDVTEAGCRAIVDAPARPRPTPRPQLPDGRVHCTYFWITDGRRVRRLPRAPARADRLAARGGRPHRLLGTAVAAPGGTRHPGARPRRTPGRRARHRPGAGHLRRRQRRRRAVTIERCGGRLRGHPQRQAPLLDRHRSPRGR